MARINLTRITESKKPKDMTSDLLVLKEADKEGKSWKVMIIQSGWSLNGFFYPGDVLKEAVSVFEGVQVFAFEFDKTFNHLPDGAQTPEGYARNIAGWIDGVKFEKVNTVSGIKEGLTGVLHLTDNFFQATLKNAWDQGKTDLLGLSIDAEAEVTEGVTEGRLGYKVTKFHIANSVDLVTTPAAGGGFLRLVAGMDKKSLVRLLASTIKKMRKKLKEKNPKFHSCVAQVMRQGKSESSAFAICKTRLKMGEDSVDKLIKMLASLLRENKDLVTTKEGVDIEKMEDAELVKLAMTQLKESDEDADNDDSDNSDDTADDTADDNSDDSSDDTDDDSEDSDEDSDDTVDTEAVEKLTEAIKDKKIDEALTLLNGINKSVANRQKVKESAEAKAKKEELEKITEKVESLEQRERNIKLQESLSRLSFFPEPIIEKLEKQFKDTKFTDEALNEAIETERDILAKITESGEVKGLGIKVGKNRAEDRQAALDLMLGYEPNEDEKEIYDGIKPFRSIKEAYISFTGDSEVRGEMDKRVTEALTTDFPQALGTSMERRMIKEYNRINIQEAWRKLASIESVDNFKQQDIIRWGGLSTLPTVNEDAAYTYASSPSEETPNYSATKRGYLLSITREMIKNDDLRTIRKWPIKLAQAANRTLGIFMFDLLINYGGGAINGGTYSPDSLALYHATHNNLTTSALGQNTLDLAITAIANQAEADSNEVLGLRAKYLVVPYELRSTAKILVDSEDIPNSSPSVGSASNRTSNPNFQAVEPIIIPAFYLRSDQNNWYVTADPADVDLMVVGFVDGRQEPEILLQDAPLLGQVFTQDRIRYKIRHEYGGVVPDYRGLYAGLQAGIS